MTTLIVAKPSLPLEKQLLHFKRRGKIRLSAFCFCVTYRDDCEIAKMWVNDSENGWVNDPENLPPQVVDSS